MKRCFTLSKAGNRLNINTFYRPHYPRIIHSVSLPCSTVSDVSEIRHPLSSKASRLSWWTRFILWIKRNILGYEC